MKASQNDETHALAQVEVSNLDSEGGKLLRKAPGNVKITAALMTDFAESSSVNSYATGEA